MNKEKTIYMQSIYNFVLLKEEVDALELLTQCDSFYRCIKAVGIKNVTVKYVDFNGKETKIEATKLPELMRAFVGFIVKLLYRFNENSDRLEKHLMLPMRIEEILSTTGIFHNSNTGSLEIISVQDIIDRYIATK